jgi:hypothetical protein
VQQKKKDTSEENYVRENKTQIANKTSEFPSADNKK